LLVGVLRDDFAERGRRGGEVADLLAALSEVEQRAVRRIELLTLLELLARFGELVRLEQVAALLERCVGGDLIRRGRLRRRAPRKSRRARRARMSRAA